jgi:hypothetical protein
MKGIITMSRIHSAPQALRRFASPSSHAAPLFLAAVLLAGAAGCKSAPPPPDDSTLTSSLNSQLAGDSSIAGLPLQATVQNGVATLSGTVLNDAQRTIAARDAAGVQGVREVINNLTVSPAAAASASAPAPSNPTPALIPRQRLEPARPPSRQSQNQPAPIERPQPAPPQAAYNPPQPPPAPRPVPPPQPVFRTVTLASGTTLPVRVTQTLDSASTQTGDSFSGVIASDIVIDGVTALPAGTAVSGNVDAVQEAAHFKGNSLLTVSLTSVKARGERISVTSDPYSVKGNGRGKNTAEKAGGGAAVGAILGGIFGGGKGAAIGAAAGGGAGAGVNAVTRGQQVQIPSETVVRFHLSSPITLKVRTDTGREHEHEHDDSSDSDLQHRPS